jgi:hypothetical protein
MIARIPVTKLAVFLVAALSCFADVIGSGVVFDNRIGDLRSITVVGHEFMNQRRLLKLSEEVRVDSNPPPIVLIISAFDNADDASQTLAGKGTTEMTYSEAVKRIGAAHERRNFRMMRYASIGHNAVIQTVDGINVSRVLVEGRDPRLLQVGKRSLELLDLQFHKLPRPVRPDGLNPAIISVYLKADRLPTRSEAEAITRDLQTLLHHDDLRVNIRTDTWFLEDSAVPLWYPFSPDQVPPNYSDYQARGEVFCLADDKAIRCP